MKMRLVGYVTGLLVLGGCSGAPAPTAEAEKPPTVVEIVAVSRGAMSESVEITGSYFAADGASARLSAAAAGRWRSIDVREGDLVRKGQVLATVDTTVQAAGTQASEAAAEVAATQADQAGLGTMAASGDLKASRDEARSALTQAILERADAISDAKNTAQAAEAEFVRVNAGARPQEIMLARQAVIQADVSFSRAKAERERVRSLSAEGYVSRRQMEEAEATVALAESGLTSAKAQLSLVEAGARPEERRIAQLALEKAKKALASTVRLGDVRVEQARAAVARVEAGRIGLQAKIAETRAAMQTVAQRQAEARAAAMTQAMGTVVAPFDGRVVRRMGNPGDVADPSVPILEVVAGGTSIDFVGNVAPTVATRLAAGMAGRAAGFASQVASIGTADATSGFVAVRLRGTQDGKVRVGEFGTVNVTIRRVADAIRVPKAAVIERNGGQECFVVVDGKAVRRTIQVGFSDGLAVQVKGGLRPGEQVVVLGQYEIEDGVSVTPTKESP